jgi:hypothetical protein
MNDLLENNNDLLSLFNKNKISNEVASLSSISSLSSSSSINSASNKNKNKFKKQLEEDNYDTKNKFKKQLENNDNKSYFNKLNKDDDDDDDDEDDENQGNNNTKVNYNNNEDEDEDEDDEDDDNDNDDDDDDDIKSNSSNNEIHTNKKDIIAEKREILYQLKRLEDKGYKIPNNYNMQSDLLEMKQEYDRIIRDKDIDSSVRFQRKMLMAFVTGTEYLNTRYDPFAIKLDGWSEQVHENIVDYDDIFEELHEKYKAKGKKMPAELRLFISLTGSAFMFHLTSRMFKESAIPGVEEVLKSNPSLMKEFQNAAAKQFIYKNTGIEDNKNQQQPPRNNNQGSGLFGMIGNLFGGLTSTPNFNNSPTMSIPKQQNIKNFDRSANDINNIINNVHSKISTHLDDDNKIETLSISDEEITSIIEDATDVNLLKKSVRNKNKRTLNI